MFAFSLEISVIIRLVRNVLPPMVSQNQADFRALKFKLNRLACIKYAVLTVKLGQEPCLYSCETFLQRADAHQ